MKDCELPPRRLFEDVQPPEDAQSGDFMFIGQLAKETGADPKTIRFYEREGLLVPPRHGRFRIYMAKDVLRLKEVLVMRRLGIGIATIHLLLESIKKNSGSESILNILTSHLESLRRRHVEVERQVAETEAMLTSVASVPDLGR